MHSESKLNFGAVELSTAAQVASYTDYHDVTVLGVFSSKDDPGINHRTYLSCDRLFLAAAKVFSTAATTFTSRQDMGFAAVYSSKMASMCVAVCCSIRLFVQACVQAWSVRDSCHSAVDKGR